MNEKLIIVDELNNSSKPTALYKIKQSTVEVTCNQCGNIYFLTKGKLKSKSKNKNFFCSFGCSKEFSNKSEQRFKSVEISETDYAKTSVIYSLEKFNVSKLMDHIEMKCPICNIIFQRTKTLIIRALKSYGKSLYCSNNCINKSKINKVTTQCKQCEKEIIVRRIQYDKHENNFCSYSCSAKYRNKHKKFGHIRSKIELYLETKIREAYPTLNLLCNDRILLEGQELDFYFPSLKFAVELNGITHYEPIYGQDRLTRSQESDNRKMISCYEKGIELAVINISDMKYFSKKRSDLVFTEIDKILTNFKYI